MAAHGPYAAENGRARSPHRPKWPRNGRNRKVRGEIGAAAVILHGRRSPVRGKRVRRRRATFQSGPRLSSHEAIHVPLGYSNIFVSVTPIIKSEIIFVANFYNFSDAIFVGDHAESEKDGAGGLNIGILIRFLGFSKEYMTVLISNIIKKNKQKHFIRRALPWKKACSVRLEKTYSASKKLKFPVWVERHVYGLRIRT